MLLNVGALAANIVDPRQLGFSQQQLAAKVRGR
jgi:hypothetical protein